MMPGQSELRRSAGQSLDQAAQELNSIPIGRVPTDVLASHSAKAQAIATIAVAQAILEVADVLRSLERGSDA